MAFTWDDYYAGTCYLHSNTGPLVSAAGKIVGVCNANVTVAPPAIINKCSLQYNMDIQGEFSNELM